MKKFCSLSVVLLLMLPSFTTGAQGLYGDVNGDGVVNISDVNAVISVVLGDHTPTPPPADDQKWVDLGLPSGTLWATCNVGAESPEDYGSYFAWGETEPKQNYDWSTYKWCNGSYETFTKYCIKSYEGFDEFVDNKTELDLEDDAAYVNWGSSWRMPTKEQQEELVYICTWTWMSKNGVNGRLVTGPNGNSIFLPAAGYHMDHSLHEGGEWGYYWSRTLNSGYSSAAKDLSFYVGVYYGSDKRCYGLTVRAVRVP